MSSIGVTLWIYLFYKHIRNLLDLELHYNLLTAILFFKSANSSFTLLIWFQASSAIDLGLLVIESKFSSIYFLFYYCWDNYLRCCLSIAFSLRNYYAADIGFYINLFWLSKLFSYVAVFGVDITEFIFTAYWLGFWLSIEFCVWIFIGCF